MKLKFRHILLSSVALLTYVTLPSANADSYDDRINELKHKIVEVQNTENEPKMRALKIQVANHKSKLESLDKESKEYEILRVTFVNKEAELKEADLKRESDIKALEDEIKKVEEERVLEFSKVMPTKAFDVTAHFESGNRNPGSILGVLADGAGQNYGTYSLTEVHTMPGYLAFLEQHYPHLRAKLTGSINSSEFNSSWERLGQTDTDEFKNSQARYLFEKTILPKIDRFKQDTGVDLLDGTHSVGAVGMFSGMIHNAGVAWYPYLVSAANTAKTDGGFNDELFITEAAGYVANNYNGVYASSIRSRYVRQPIQEKQRTEKFVYKRVN